jgi:hypothetical protein
MDFGFNVAALLNTDSDGIAILSGKDLEAFDSKSKEAASLVIDEMGKASSIVSIKIILRLKRSNRLLLHDIHFSELTRSYTLNAKGKEQSGF